MSLISCIGLQWILRYGSILNTPRNYLKKIVFFKNLLDCSLCTGFWCGITIGILEYGYKAYSDIFFMSLASSACCWFFDSLLDLIQNKTK